MKFLSALAASAALLAIWFAWSNSTQASTPDLGQVLARLADASSFELRVQRDGQQATVWVRQPGLVRWQDSEQQYQIARGSRLWKVDEVGETAASQENPWLSDAGHVDLLALLDVRPEDERSLLATQPSGSAEFGGKQSVVYRQTVRDRGRALQLSVFVDPKSHDLLGITARDPKRDPAEPPLAELTLLALNTTVDEAKFRVPIKLAEQDLIGKVTDTQGIVVLRPVGTRRWTPLCREVLVQPGDWIRTDVRGANAVTVELASKVTLTVGPGSLVELVSPDEARLHSGTVQVARGKQTPNAFTLLGQGKNASN